MSELLPCPHCGGTVIRDFKVFERNGWRIDCNTCDGGFHKGSRDEAVKAWNHRIEASRPSTDEVERVARAIAISVGTEEYEWRAYEVEAKAAIEAMKG